MPPETVQIASGSVLLACRTLVITAADQTRSPVPERLGVKSRYIRTNGPPLAFEGARSDLEHLIGHIMAEGLISVKFRRFQVYDLNIYGRF